MHYFVKFRLSKSFTLFERQYNLNNKSKSAYYRIFIVNIFINLSFYVSFGNVKILFSQHSYV